MNQISSSQDSKQTGQLAMNRRHFLMAGGALVISFALPSSLRAQTAAFPAIAPDRLDSWLAVGEDGNVTVFTGRIDMGTGTETVYVQAVAEELDVPVSVIRIILGDTARTPEQGKSTASNSILLNLPPMRQAAAEARLNLVEMAAKRLNTPADKLTVTDGVVHATDDATKKVSYRDLIGGKRFDIKLELKGSGITTEIVGRAKLKDPSQFKVLGQSVPRVDIPAKVIGSHKFVHDVKVEGMLHGTVVLPPEIGAKLVSVDGFPREIPGLVKVVTRGSFVGIVTETEQAAVQARNEIKVTWSRAEGTDLTDIYKAVRNAPIVKDVEEQKVGDAAAAIASATSTIESEYFLPFNTHGMMGPSCAVADWRDGKMTIWTGTQWPDGTRRDVADMLGIPADNVRVIWTASAGSYGRLGTDDAAADAALLSKEIGKPVRVQWQRNDEHRAAPFNPGAVIKVKAGLDANGNITAWTYENWTASHSRGERGNMAAWRALGNNPDYARLSGGADKPSYSFPNVQVVSHYTDELARAIYMRSVGGIQNVFAIESAMDELAAKAGVDPIEFRLRHLKDERMKAVLRAVAEKAQWKPGTTQRFDAGPGLIGGRGVAMVGTEGPATVTIADQAYVATIVDVVVNKSTGEAYVKNAYVGFDAGRIANPDGLRNQIEGGTIMGISRAMKEEVTFDGRSVTSSDWAAYPVLRFSEAPEILEVIMLDTPNRPKGAGEPPNVPPAAAIGNAINAATGIRVRTLPFTPERLKVAFAEGTRKAAG